MSRMEKLKWGRRGEGGLEEVEELGKPSSISSVAAAPMQGEENHQVSRYSSDTVGNSRGCQMNSCLFKDPREIWEGVGLYAAAHRAAWNPPRHRPWLRSTKDGQLSFAKPAGV